MNELRQACALVARQATRVAIVDGSIGAYAAALALDGPNQSSEDDQPSAVATREDLAAYWLTLDAINFGSGWFPTLEKRPGRSGYHTIAAALRERFATAGPWPAGWLSEIDTATVAATLGQDPEHELMALFAASLRDLGTRVAGEYAGRFAAVADSAAGSAVTLARRLGGWRCFADKASPRHRTRCTAY